MPAEINTKFNPTKGKLLKDLQVAIEINGFATGGSGS
jgi:hypothetical protein